MAKQGADYSMDDVSSIVPSGKVSSIGGTFPLGRDGIAGENNIGGVESAKTHESLTYQADQLFDEDFGPKVDMDAVTHIPGGATTPFYSGEGTGDVCDYPPGFDDYRKRK